MNRILLLLLTVLFVASPLRAQESKPVFVVVTSEYKWADGLASPAGEVERIIAIEGDNYILWHPSGVRYPLPKRFGKLITTDEAAVRLVEQRQKLYSQLSAAASLSPQQPNSPEQLQRYLDLFKSLQAATAPAAGNVPPAGADSLDALEGATIVANDGTFLGVVSRNNISPNSITNEIGKFGSSISPTSIFNSIGKYGSDISPLSPFNNIASTPPKIVTRDKKWIYITTNEILTPRISPQAVIGWAKRGQ